AYALAVVYVVLAEPQAGVVNHVELYLFGEGHAGALQVYPVEHIAPEDTHARLRVGDPAEPQDAGGICEYHVAEHVAPAHGLGVPQWKAAGRHKIQFLVEQVVNNGSYRVGGICAVTVGSSHYVASCTWETGL